MLKHNSLINACKEIGKNPQLVQAGGGNISLKLDNKNMLVKVSGVALKKVSKEKGVIKINYQNIKDFIASLDISNVSNKLEKDYNKLIIDSSENNELRPSMETGLHALLGKAVIHTHPVIVNTITCSQNGKDLINKIFPDKELLWIPYKTPGVNLSKEIFNAIKLYSNVQSSNLWLFLENHGLIVSDQNLGKCVKHTKKIVKKIHHYLTENGVQIYEYETFNQEIIKNQKIKSELVSIFMKNKENQKLLKRHIFPDSVVFCGCGFSFNNSNPDKIVLYNDGSVELPKKSHIKPKSMIETLIATIYIHLLINQFGVPSYLSDEETNFLKTMESEKYRQKIDGAK